VREAKSGRIGVIGGGLGGLAAACTLAARGYDVVLLEKNAWLGGKAAVLQIEGYRFDMGPTILLMPSVLKRIFAEAGRDLVDELDLVALDPQWRSFFADGTTLDLDANSERMAKVLDRFVPSGAEGRGYQRFLDLSRRLEDISNRYFFWRSIGGLKDMFDPSTAARPATLGDVLAMRPWSTVAGTIRSYVSDPRVAQMLDHFTQYVGSSPDSSPAVLCGIANMQTEEGIWYPRGGTRAVAESLERLARDLGVEIQSGVGVAHIAALVSNADAVRTHRELLKGHAAAAKFDRRRSYEPACSGVVLYLGLDRRYEHLRHHDFVFSRDSHEEFDFIYRRGEPAPDPTCYVCAPAATDPSVAPPGGEALYVLVHTPYLRPHHDWKALFPAYRQIILDKLKKTAGLGDLEKRIRVERWLTPQDIHDRYHVLNGAIYGLASHGRLTGAFKPGNRSPDVPGLYLAGGAAHPGPGMPMVLMSGWIAANTLDGDGLVEPPRARLATTSEVSAR
jgi:diapolycopene oxygenase